MCHGPPASRPREPWGGGSRWGPVPNMPCRLIVTVHHPDDSTRAPGELCGQGVLVLRTLEEVHGDSFGQGGPDARLAEVIWTNNSLCQSKILRSWPVQIMALAHPCPQTSLPI